MPIEKKSEEKSQYSTSPHVFDEASYYEDGEVVMGSHSFDELRSDTSLGEEACDLLCRHHSINASHVIISVHSGIISLSGQVNSNSERREIEECLNGISGVLGIVNKLQLKS